MKLFICINKRIFPNIQVNPVTLRSQYKISPHLPDISYHFSYENLVLNQTICKRWFLLSFIINY